MQVNSSRPSFGRIEYHVLFWIAIWITYAILFRRADDVGESFQRTGLTVLGQATLVYFNFYILLPQLYFKKQYTWYIIAALAATLLFSLGFNFLTELIQGPPEYIGRRQARGLPIRRRATFLFVGRSFFPYFTALAISSVYRVTQVSLQRDRETIQLRSDMLETELKFLRSQTNPHTLFNVLNNIYTLTVIQSEKAPDALLKLSELLRYMLYESRSNLVELKDELRFLRNYIDLQMLKDPESMRVTTHLPVTSQPIQIAPMLLIPFVENAFKHSQVEDPEHGWIDISLKAEGQSIDFRVHNSLPLNHFTKDKQGGIGIENVQRRLNLLYPNRHSLYIDDKDDQFSVYLKLW